MSLLNISISMALGYLLGCIQAAYIVGKVVKNIDIRKYGTQNAGASNITTVMGWKYGIITAIIDILKAFIAVIIVGVLFPNNIVLSFMAGSLAILGHIFPLFLGFKGGKGAASLIGMSLAYDYRIGLILIIAIVAATVITDYIALGTVLMYILFVLSLHYLRFPVTIVWIAVALTVIVVYKHYPNINRIIKRQEIGLRAVINKNKK